MARVQRRIACALGLHLGAACSSSELEPPLDSTEAAITLPPPGVPFTSPLLSSSNNDKCTSTQTSGVSDVLIRSVRLTAACTIAAGCSQVFYWPLVAAPGTTCTAGSAVWDVDHAKAYLAGFRIERPRATQVQTLTVQAQSAAPQLVHGAWRLPIKVTVAELALGLPTPQVEEQPRLDIVLDLEIAMAAPGSGLSLQAVSAGGTASGAVVNYAVPLVASAPLQFLALSGFSLWTSTSVGPAGEPHGSNITHFGLRTKVTPLASGGSANDVHCVFAGDTPSPAAQSTSCSTSFVALVGTNTAVKRATSQPVALFGPTRTLDDTVSSWSIPVAAAGTGRPSCGMKSFFVSSVPAPVPVTGGSGTWNISSFKQRALGFLLPDCDSQLLSGHQFASLSANGLAAWSPPLAWPDQSPVPQFGSQFFHAPPDPVFWNGGYELDSAGLL